MDRSSTEAPAPVLRFPDPSPVDVGGDAYAAAERVMGEEHLAQDRPAA